MIARFWIPVLLALASALAPVPGVAAESGQAEEAPAGGLAAASLSEAEREAANAAAYARQRRQAALVVGHIGLAGIAMLHDMTPEATANVKSALAAIRSLERLTDRFATPSPIAALRLSYRSAKTQSAYLLPMLDDTLAVRTMSEGLIHSRKPEVSLADARVAHVALAFSTKEMHYRLERAASALNARQPGVAASTLIEAMYGASAAQADTGDTDAETAALESVREHLALARELARDKNFDSAGFALDHALQAVAEYRDAAGGDARAELNPLPGEIALLREQAARRVPALPRIVNQKTAQWLAVIDAPARRDGE